MRRTTILICVLIGCGSALPAVSAEGEQASCGVASVLDMCDLLSHPVDKGDREEIIAAWQGPASMAAVSNAAASLGVALRGVRAPLDALCEVGGPKIIHFKDPDHFLVMARASPEWVQLLDSGRVIVVPREEVEERYSGHALILRQTEEDAGGAKLRLDGFHHRFGIVGVGQVVEHSFGVTNAGDQELAIALQSGSCGSLPATIGKEVLAPGESTCLTAKFTVTYSGSVMGSVRLTTNDLTRPVAFVTIHGTVPHDLRVYPDRLDMVGAKTDTLSSAIVVSGPPEMDLGEVSCRGQELGLAVGEPKIGDDERKSWRITVSLQPGTLVGEFADELSIRTTHKDRPLITIPIRGTVVPDLDLQPPSAFFGFAKPGDKPAASINLTSRSGAPFRLLQVAPGDPRITVTQTETEGGYRLDVVVPTDKPGVFEGEVLVKTDVPLEEAVKIPVYVHVVQ